MSACLSSPKWTLISAWKEIDPKTGRVVLKTKVERSGLSYVEAAVTKHLYNTYDRPDSSEPWNEILDRPHIPVMLMYVER